MKKPGSLSGVSAMWCSECKSIRTVREVNNELSQPRAWFVECSHTRISDLGTPRGVELFVAPLREAFERPHFVSLGRRSGSDIVLEDWETVGSNSLEEITG